MLVAGLGGSLAEDVTPKADRPLFSFRPRSSKPAREAAFGAA